MPMTIVAGVLMALTAPVSHSVLAGSFSVSSISRNAIATSADDRPPKPLSAATISGICVVGVFLAISAPIAPPTTTPARIRPMLRFEKISSVATIASSIAISEMRLPWRQVLTLVSFLMPKTNRNVARR